MKYIIDIPFLDPINEIMIDDIFIFVKIVQQQSLARAAKKLAMPTATVSRRLQRLEEQLGNKLIHRSARAFILTSQGETFYSAYLPIVEQFIATQQQLEQQLHALVGTLKVLAPTNISIGILQPMWSSFIAQHPQIKLELNLSNQVQDLLDSQADIALRIGPQQSSSLYQKRVGCINTLLVAAPQYLEKAPPLNQLADLSEHRVIGTDILNHWPMHHIDTHQQQHVSPIFCSVINDVKLVSELVCDGLGIALLPYSEISVALKNGDLINILPQWHGPIRDVYVVWPSGKLLSERARCLKAFIENFYAAQMNE